MSKLREALERKRRGERAGGMGFGTRTTERDRALLLGAIGVSAKDGAKAIKAGMDVVALAADDAAAAGEALGAVAGGLRGVAIGALEADDLEGLDEAGADFVVADPETTAAGIVESDLGLVLEAEEDWEEGRLRTLAALSPDAVFVRAKVERYTLARRLSLARVAGLCGAPLMVQVDAAISSADLEALRESGVGVVTLPGRTAASKIAALIKQIESVPMRRPQRRGDSGFAILPLTGAASHDEGADGDE